MNKQGSYQFETLEGRHIEADFLEQRAQLRLDGFIDLLKRHHFPENGKILEIGSAHGIRTHLMAKNFPGSKVIGVDRSPELLELARERYHLKNLSFQLADLYELPFSDNEFDFIYVRLVFMHLNDPMTALENLKRILKPGGRILIEDADRDCMFFEPAPESFSPFWNKVQDGQKKLGGDPNVGRKLATYLKMNHFNEIHSEVQTILGNGEEIEFLARTLLPSLNIYLDSQDRGQGKKAIQDLFEISKKEHAHFYHFWFIASGRKP